MAAAAPFIPVPKKNLTPTQFKIAVGTKRYFKFVGEIHIGKELKVKAGDKKKEPAQLADVTDLETGETGFIICNTVLRSTLMEEYPNHTYVGKCFQVEKNARAAGREYDQFSILEIEDPTAQSAPAAAAASAPAADPAPTRPGPKGGK